MKMKLLLLLFCSCLLSLSTKCQIAVLRSNIYPNKATLCLPNPISVVVKGISSNSIFLKTNNGNIEDDTYSSKSNYLYYPKTSGKSMIYIYKKSKKPKLIDSTVIYIDRIPVNRPRFAYAQSGLLTLSAVLSQVGLDGQMEEICSGKFHIAKYTITVSRHNIVIFDRTVEGAEIDSISHDFFYNLQNGDSLVFREIAIRDCDNTIRSLPSIAFAITDAYEYTIINGVTDTIMVTNPITGADEIRIQHFKRVRAK